jgi:hypothetical protein
VLPGGNPRRASPPLRLKKSTAQKRPDRPTSAQNMQVMTPFPNESTFRFSFVFAKPNMRLCGGVVKHPNHNILWLPGLPRHMRVKRTDLCDCAGTPKGKSMSVPVAR